MEPYRSKRQKTARGMHQPGDEYLEDILRNMKRKRGSYFGQHKYRVTSGMLTKAKSGTTPDISRIPPEIQSMRPEIIQLLKVAGEELGPLPQTQYLSVNLPDRFCCEQIFHGEPYYKLSWLAALL